MLNVLPYFSHHSINISPARKQNQNEARKKLQVDGTRVSVLEVIDECFDSRHAAPRSFNIRRHDGAIGGGSVAI